VVTSHRDRRGACPRDGRAMADEGEPPAATRHSAMDPMERGGAGPIESERVPATLAVPVTIWICRTHGAENWCPRTAAGGLRRVLDGCHRAT